MIPKNVWQTYECKYDDLPDTAKKFTNLWQEKNPSWTYGYMSESQRREFVLKNFGDEWVKIYDSYSINVCRADLWRYMVLFIHGGVYADLDFECFESLDLWVDQRYGFIVSSDMYGAGFTQMIFASEPNNIFIKAILNNIYEQFNKKELHNSVIDYETKETGYIIFTKSILELLNMDSGADLSNLESDSYNHSLSAKKNNFLCYIGKDSKIIHEKFGRHHKAGFKNIFGNEYIKWAVD